jgi:hypothetical protein
MNRYAEYLDSAASDADIAKSGQYLPISLLTCRDAARCYAVGGGVERRLAAKRPTPARSGIEAEGESRLWRSRRQPVLIAKTPDGGAGSEEFGGVLAPDVV